MNYFGDSSQVDRAPGLSEPSEPRAGVGTLLRATRLRLGQELEDIAAILRIRLSYLQALEEGNDKALPGTTYAIGFVRAYADYLGLDSDEVVRRFKAEVNATQHRTELVFPAPVPDSGIPRGAVLLMALVVAGAAYGGWYYLSSVDKRVVDLVSDPSERLMSLLEPAVPAPQTPDRTAAAATPTERLMAPREAPPQAATAPGGMMSPAPTASGPVEPVTVGEVRPETPPPPAADSTEPTGTPQVAETVSSEVRRVRPGASSDVPASPVAAAGAETEVASLPREPQPAVAPQPAPRSEIVTASIAPAEPADASDIPPAPSAAVTETIGGGQAFGVAEDRARIVLRAREDAWVQVRDADNGLVLTRMLRAGDIYRVPPRQGLRLITGNAGALEVLVDGKVTPPLGAVGVVRRDVPLDADRLLAGVATN